MDYAKLIAVFTRFNPEDKGVRLICDAIFQKHLCNPMRLRFSSPIANSLYNAVIDAMDVWVESEQASRHDNPAAAYMIRICQHMRSSVPGLSAWKSLTIDAATDDEDWLIMEPTAAQSQALAFSAAKILENYRK